MRKLSVTFAALFVLTVTCAWIAAAQAAPAKAAGSYDVTVKRPDSNISERLTLQQDGTKITGTVKNDRGEFPVLGELVGNVLRVEVTDGDNKYAIHATIEENRLDGTIRIGKNEYIWAATKSK